MTTYKPADAPKEWTAKWIWHPVQDFMDNFHMWTRREITLQNAPGEAICLVSANNVYELYINGQFIGRGPSPSYPKWQYFDRYDVGAFLHKGPNVIAARCYNYGVGMESILRQNPGPGGFLLQLETGVEVVLETDDSWRVLRDPSRRPETELISGHRGGWKEVCDARLEVLDWTDTGFDDSGWTQAHVLGPFDCEPWENLVQREIPPLRLETVLPRDVFYHTCGMTYGGGKYDVSMPEALIRDDDSCCTVDPLRCDFAPSIIVDFGASVYGYYEIEIADSSGGLLELSYGESLNLTLVDRLIMREGPQVYRPFDRRGGRYLMLTFRDCPGPVRIRRALCHRQSFPVEQRGEFACSDDLLNRIWQIGRYTVQMCMQDHYEDCPWREQALYTGDLAVTGLLSYYAFGAQDLAPKCLRQFARLQDEDGLIPPVGPAPVRDCRLIPEYPAFWVIGLWEYYRHWGDEDLLRELYPNVVRCMEWYSTHQDEHGFFSYPAKDRLLHFVDNLSNISAGDVVAAEQIIYCRAITTAASMAEVVGDSKRADELRDMAADLSSTIERLFWREDRHCLADGLEPDADATQITNGLAVLYDIVGPERQRMAARVMLDRTKAPPMRAGYMNFYMVEALAANGMTREALNRIREYWGAAVSRGATTFWETFDPDSPDATMPDRLWSLCHACCSGPVYSLPAHIAGIRTLEPGFRRVEVAPELLDLDWVRAAVPTPLGEVRLTCHRVRQTGCVEIDVEIPSRAAAEVLVPLPGRDTGTVYLEGKPVSPGAEASALRELRSDLSRARMEERGLRLYFDAAEAIQRIQLKTTTEHIFPSTFETVNRLWQPWEESDSSE